MTTVIRQWCDWPRFWWKDVEQFVGDGPLEPQLLSREDGDSDLLGGEAVVLFIPRTSDREDGEPTGRRITMFSPQVRWLHHRIHTITGWVIGDGTFAAEEELARFPVPEYAHRERWRWEP